MTHTDRLRRALRAYDLAGPETPERVAALAAVLSAAHQLCACWPISPTPEPLAGLHMDELRIDTYHAGEHSGFLHTNEIAVRITHLPTGAYVESKDERRVHRNKQMCLDMLPAAILRKTANDQ